jgi:hypothetical protein
MEGPASESGCDTSAACSPIGLLLTDTFFGTADGSFSVASGEKMLAQPHPRLQLEHWKIKRRDFVSLSTQCRLPRSRSLSTTG